MSHLHVSQQFPSHPWHGSISRGTDRPDRVWPRKPVVRRASIGFRGANIAVRDPLATLHACQPASRAVETDLGTILCDHGGP